MDRGYQDMAGPVVAELDDQFSQIGLDGRYVLLLKVFVEADLLGRHRLDLDHLTGTGGLNQFGDNVIGFVGIACPMDYAATLGDVVLQLLQQFRKFRQHILFECAPGLAQLPQSGIPRPPGRAWF